MSTTLEKKETAILSRAIGLENDEFSPEAARSILAIELTPTDRDELQRLAAFGRRAGDPCCRFVAREATARFPRATGKPTRCRSTPTTRRTDTHCTM